MQGGRVAWPAFGVKPPLDEVVHQRTLNTAFLQGGFVVKIGGDPRRLAIEQQFGHAALAGARERILELPLCPGHRPARDRAAELVFRQWRPKPGPQDHDDDVGAARLWDVVGVLEVVRRDQRLAFPLHRLDIKVIGEFTLEPRNDLLGLQPFWPHVGRRRDKDTDCGQLRHAGSSKKTRTPRHKSKTTARINVSPKLPCSYLHVRDENQNTREYSLGKGPAMSASGTSPTS